MTLPDFKGPFMPSMIPAAPGTNIIELGEGNAVLRTPIVAWAPDAENPYKAPHPITVDGLARLVKGRAVEHPNGMIHSRDHSLCFETEAEWVVIAMKGPKASTGTPRPEAEKTPAQQRDEEVMGGELEIDWVEKTFKTNSFYRYDDGTLDFVFQIDGGTPPPKQTGPVTKIKRDEFMALKKTVDVADADDLRNGIAPGLDDIGTYDTDEDEDDLVGGGPDPEDDDDDDDLI